MTYYTNNNQIKELMLDTVDVEVKGLDALASIPLKEVTLYIFDPSLFFLRLPDTTVWSDWILLRRPDWGGLILEMLKQNKAYIFWGLDWCRVLYRSNVGDFRFIHCSDPIMANDHTCLISEGPVLHNVKDAVTDLLEPIRFGQDIAKRLTSKSNDRGLKSMLNFQRGSYREICMNLEELASELIHQRDAWKDRFFLKAIEEDDSMKICSSCKEDMRQAFYQRGDEEAALKWRPGKWGNCPARNCKHYSWESFEEEYHEDYIRDLKTEEYVDYESDGECNESDCSCHDR